MQNICRLMLGGGVPQLADVHGSTNSAAHLCLLHASPRCAHRLTLRLNSNAPLPAPPAACFLLLLAPCCPPDSLAVAGAVAAARLPLVPVCATLAPPAIWDATTAVDGCVAGAATASPACAAAAGGVMGTDALGIGWLSRNSICTECIGGQKDIY
jgi:hypothetical protein